MCKIAIVENYPLFSAGILSMLNELEEVKVIAEAQNVDMLLLKTVLIIPEVIVFDIIHSENAGIKSLKKMTRLFPKVPILIITNDEYADCFEEYIRIGVKGFIFSNAGSEELITAIKRLKIGDEYFPKDVWKILKNAIQSRKYTPKKGDKLTDRELGVMKLFTLGLTYKEIGSNLNISPRTVETHKNNILAKLKIHTTAEMIKYAYRNNIFA